jgi:hypothetical protein
MKLDEIFGISGTRIPRIPRNWPLTKKDEHMYYVFRQEARLTSDDIVYSDYRKKQMRAFDAWGDIPNHFHIGIMSPQSSSNLYWQFVADTIGFLRQLDNDRVDGDIDATEDEIFQRIKNYIAVRVTGKVQTIYRMPRDARWEDVFQDVKTMHLYADDTTVQLIMSFGNPFTARDSEQELLSFTIDEREQDEKEEKEQKEKEEKEKEAREQKEADAEKARQDIRNKERRERQKNKRRRNISPPNFPKGENISPPNFPQGDKDLK